MCKNFKEKLWTRRVPVIHSCNIYISLSVDNILVFMSLMFIFPLLKSVELRARTRQGSLFVRTNNQPQNLQESPPTVLFLLSYPSY